MRKPEQHRSLPLTAAGLLAAGGLVVGSAIGIHHRLKRRNQQLGYNEGTVLLTPNTGRYLQQPLETRLQVFGFDERGEPDVTSRVGAVVFHSSLSGAEKTVTVPAILEQFQPTDSRAVGQAIGRLLATGFIEKAPLLSDAKIIGLTTTAEGVQAEERAEALQLAIADVVTRSTNGNW